MTTATELSQTNQQAHAEESARRVMGEPQINQKAKSTNLRNTFIDKLFRQVICLLSPSAVINNLIGIGITIFALYLLHTGVLLKNSQDAVHFLHIGILIAGCIQLIHAAKRNLLIPIIVTAVGFYFSHNLPEGHLFLTYDATFYQYMMLAGIFGLGVSVINLP